jgi:hypothetical protein
MKRFAAQGLTGGDSQQENFNTTVFLGVIGILVIMAGLMWGGQIQFASSQDLNLTASILTTTAVLLMFYILYSLTVKANACVAV